MARVGSERGLSPHPTDRLIRELVHTRRPAAVEEVVAILLRLASAPFDPQTIRPRARERGVVYVEDPLGAQEASAVVHLVRRVVVDEQWSWGTTVEQDLADLRAAVRHPNARAVVCARRGGGGRVAAAWPKG